MSHLISGRPALAAACLALLATAGCSDGIDRSVTNVTGTVLMDGKPLAGAQVVFYPKDKLSLGDSIPASTDEDGKFFLVKNIQSDVILKPGMYRVLVGKFSSKPPPNAKPPEEDPDYDAFRGYNILPSVYNLKGKSPNIVEVKSGDNDFTVELKSKP